MPNDGEAETQPSMAARRGRIRLTEPIEHEGQHVGSNADAGIGDLNFGGTIRASQSDGNQTIGARELERVRKNVPENLLQPVRVRPDGGDFRIEMRLEPDSFCLRRRTQALDCRSENLADVERLHRDRHLAGDDSRDIEDVFNQPDLRLGVSFDDLHRVGGVLIELTHPEDPRPSKNSIQRRPQLVRQCAEKLILQAIGFLRLAV